MPPPSSLVQFKQYNSIIRFSISVYPYLYLLVRRYRYMCRTKAKRSSTLVSAKLRSWRPFSPDTPKYMYVMYML